MSYELDKDVADYFEFEFKEGKYKMTYPTGEFIDKIRKLSPDDMAKELLTLITPVSENAPDIQELMNKKNTKVLQNFNNMVKAEFGIED